MQESSTYQMLLEEGLEKGLKTGLERGFINGKRDALIKLGQQKWGNPLKSIQKALDAIEDPVQLDLLLTEIAHAGTWGELLKMGRATK
ncbi:MAG: hypothetical protein JWM11_4618 [Planctomycetaceae bacterium]|nr:hypothetical protein [Planctomycetaceae bacterium]